LTKEETAKIMSVLEVAFPRYYAGQGEEKKRTALNLWHLMLQEYPYDLVAAAVKATIATNVFPPVISEIIGKIQTIKQGSDMTELEAWGYIGKAIRSSCYRSQEEWEKLPEELRHVVTPDLLRSWAMVESDDVETVIQSNFLRTFRAAKKRQKEYDALPGSVKEYMAKIGVDTDGMLAMPGQGDRYLDGYHKRKDV